MTQVVCLYCPRSKPSGHSYSQLVLLRVGWGILWMTSTGTGLTCSERGLLCQQRKIKHLKWLYNIVSWLLNPLFAFAGHFPTHGIDLELQSGTV